QTIVTSEVRAFVARHREETRLPVELTLRVRFNPELKRAWFGAVAEVINQVTMLSIVLTGPALIREREHGTIEHLLVLPVAPLEFLAAKGWAMAFAVLVACAASLGLVVQGRLGMRIEGSVPLFLGGAARHLFATTSRGISLATVAR